MGLLRSPKATVSRLQTRKEDVGTRDAQTYSLNFPGVLRERVRDRRHMTLISRYITGAARIEMGLTGC